MQRVVMAMKMGKRDFHQWCYSAHIWKKCKPPPVVGVILKPALSEPEVSFTYNNLGQRATMTDASGVKNYTNSLTTAWQHRKRRPRHHAHRMSTVSRLITYRTIHISTWWNRLCFLSSSEYDFTYTIQNILCHKLCPNLSKFDWISPIITGFHWVRDATVTPENKYT